MNIATPTPNLPRCGLRPAREGLYSVWFGNGVYCPNDSPPPLQDAPASAAGEGWGGGSDICRYTKSGLKYRPFTYTNPAILYVNCRQCCLGGGASPTLQVLRTGWSAQALQPSPKPAPFCPSPVGAGRG